MFTIPSLCAITLLVNHVNSEIQLNMYNNSIFFDEAINSVELTELKYSIPYNQHPFTVSIQGTIKWVMNVDKYYFLCEFSSEIFGFLWIDDHIICYNGVYLEPIFSYWNLSFTSTAYNTRESFLRMELYSNITNISTTNLDFNILWSFNNNDSLHAINNSFLTTNIPSLQQQRFNFQKSLISNSFSTWQWTNLLSIIRMPDSFGITFGLCLNNTAAVNNQILCQTQQVIQDNLLRVGAFAKNLSYWEYNLTWNNIEISYKYAQLFVNKTYSNLYLKMEILSNTNKNTIIFASISSRMYWNRYGNINNINKQIISSKLNCFMSFNGYNLPQKWSLCSNINKTQKYNNNKQILFQFDSQNVVYFTTDINVDSVEDINNIISTQQQYEYNTYTKYGNLSDVAIATQAAYMWNLIYSPEEYGPFAPIARGPWAEKAVGDFQYVLFGWDTTFCTYIMSLDSINWAISNFIQLIKAKTVNGFIASYKWDVAEYLTYSSDRSNPILASNVLNRMYNKYGDQIKWVIELLFDDLLDWVNWYWIRRRCQPRGLICWGSDPTPPVEQEAQDDMQSSRLESGLDNSPMYDGNYFNKTTHHMMLYDVGANGMYAKELQSIIKLAKVIGRNTIVNELESRYNFIVDGILNVLWNDDLEIFINKRSDTDNWYPIFSPTLFYPLMTGELNVSKAETMVTKYLLNPDYFCINNNWPINQNKTCYYGLPSISANDPSFSSQNYWRGLTWAPMVQLVWWSLDEYVNESTIIQNAQNSLELQMREMMLNIWSTKRHICENYSPQQQVQDCTGLKFYHWGGLSGFISLIHDYY